MVTWREGGGDRRRDEGKKAERKGGREEQREGGRERITVFIIGIKYPTKAT